MKDNYKKGFISGILFATSIMLLALVISCTVTPLEAGASELGSNPYNPIFVKIVD